HAVGVVGRDPFFGRDFVERARQAVTIAIAGLAITITIAIAITWITITIAGRAIAIPGLAITITITITSTGVVIAIAGRTRCVAGLTRIAVASNPLVVWAARGQQAQRQQRRTAGPCSLA